MMHWYNHWHNTRRHSIIKLYQIQSIFSSNHILPTNIMSLHLSTTLCLCQSGITLYFKIIMEIKMSFKCLSAKKMFIESILICSFIGLPLSGSHIPKTLTHIFKMIPFYKFCLSTVMMTSQNDISLN